MRKTQNVAQFPLPILAGIGHDRDETVIDRIANVRVKTPTAAAEWFISRAMEADRKLAELQTVLSSEVNNLLQNERQKLSSLGQQLPSVIDRRLIIENNLLSRFMPLLRQNIAQRISGERQRLALREETIRLSSPQHILKRGYSLTLKDGKAVHSATELKSGDRIVTFFGEGCSESQIL